MRHASACFQLIFAATRGRVAGIGCWGNRSVSAKKKPASTIPAAKLALYERLIATDPTIERKGATVPYTSTNGKIVHVPLADRRASDPAARRGARDVHEEIPGE